jgi:salicylate hydroxylase
LAQGAAMAVEDGIVLAECIERAMSLKSIPLYLSAFESIRKERTSLVQTGSVKSVDFWHMEDGAHQRARDAIMKNVEIDEETFKELRCEGTQNPNPWNDLNLQPWLFGYDAIEEVYLLRNRSNSRQNKLWTNWMERIKTKANQLVQTGEEQVHRDSLK